MDGADRVCFGGAASRRSMPRFVRLSGCGSKDIAEGHRWGNSIRKLHIESPLQINREVLELHSVSHKSTTINSFIYSHRAIIRSEAQTMLLGQEESITENSQKRSNIFLLRLGKSILPNGPLTLPAKVIPKLPAQKERR